MRRNMLIHLLLVAGALSFFPTPADAQAVPWELFSDVLSDSTCGVVNTAGAELVVLNDTGQLVIVTGPDVTLQDSLVDFDGFVFLEGQPTGLIDFAEDADGFRSLWWLSLTGRVVDVDGLTADVSQTDLFPSDFSNVSCDACPLWDDPTVCAPVVEPPPSLLPINLNLCGINAALSMLLTAVGMALISFRRR